MDYLDFLRYRRDAFIHKCSKTEEGREYLENAWRIKQTKPDRNGLRQHFGQGVTDGR